MRAMRPNNKKCYHVNVIVLVISIKRDGCELACDFVVNHTNHGASCN